MPDRHLLDTNAAIALLADADVFDEAFGAMDQIYLSIISLGELYYGAWRSTHVEQNLLRVDDLARSSVIVGCDVSTAREYGLIHSQLRRKGRPIPANDLWIAAQARQHGLLLITRDSHFDEVEGLLHRAW